MHEAMRPWRIAATRSVTTQRRRRGASTLPSGIMPACLGPEIARLILQAQKAAIRQTGRPVGIATFVLAAPDLVTTQAGGISGGRWSSGRLRHTEECREADCRKH